MVGPINIQIVIWSVTVESTLTKDGGPLLDPLVDLVEIDFVINENNLIERIFIGICPSMEISVRYGLSGKKYKRK